MTLFQIVIVSLILYICIYALADRICKCVEHCATNKAFSRYLDSKGIKMAEIPKEFEKMYKEASNNGQSGKTEI